VAGADIRCPTWVTASAVGAILLAADAWAAQPEATREAVSREAQEPPAQEAAGAEQPGEKPATSFLLSERLSGDWGGVRPRLEENGITVDLSLTTIFQQNVRGGLRTRNAHSVSGSYDLEVTLDFGRMKLWPGGQFYALAEGSWDEGISRHVGDLFGVNTDAAGDRSIDVTELWYEQALFDQKLRVRFGKLDLAVDFDTNAAANDETSQFLNYGLGQTANIPFPQRGQGIQFVASPAEWFYFGAAVADAEASDHTAGFRSTYHGLDDFFSIYEFGFAPAPRTGWGVLTGNYRFGLWYDPRPKPRFFNDLGGRLRTVPLKRDDTGFYVSWDQVIFRENPQDESDEQGLSLFGRYGYAHADVNAVEHFWSVGAQYLGLVPTRDEDVLAIGVAQGVLSEQLRREGADPHRETAIEVYYRCQVLPWLSVSPDFQWILRPGGENGRDAFVAGLRLQISF
jgi:porin